MNKFALSALAALVGFSVTSVCAQTLTGALQQGVSRSPALQYALSQISASESSVNQARSGWLPNISVSAGQQAVGESSDTGDNQYAVSVQQNVFDFGRTGDRVDNAKYNKGSQIWKALDEAETVSSKIAETYFNILKGQRLLANNQVEMTEHKRILELAAARADGGMDNQGDVRQVEVRIRGLEASAENIRAQLEATNKEYQILVGTMPGQLEEPDLDFLNQEISKDLRELIRISPQIRSLQMDQAAVGAQYQYLRKSWLPQLSVSVSQGKTSIYAENDTQVMLNVTSNLFDGGNAYFEAENAAKQIESARWNVQKSVEDNATNVAQGFQEAIGYKQEAEIYLARESQSLQVMELYNDQYRVNRRSIIDLLNAAQEYYQTIDSQINSVANYRITLIRAIGTLGRINQAFGITTGIQTDEEIEQALSRQKSVMAAPADNDALPQQLAVPVSTPATLPAASENTVAAESITPPVQPEHANTTTEEIADPVALLRGQ